MGQMKVKAKEAKRRIDQRLGPCLPEKTGLSLHHL